MARNYRKIAPVLYNRDSGSQSIGIKSNENSLYADEPECVVSCTEKNQNKEKELLDEKQETNNNAIHKEKYVPPHLRNSVKPKVANFSPPYTHFFSLPLNTVENMDTFERFKRVVLESSLDGMHESCFISSSRLHLTLFLLSLENPTQIQKACELVNSLSLKINEILQDSFALKICGIESFEKLSSAKVVYAPVEENLSKQKLRNLCKLLIEEFSNAGLLPDYEIKKQEMFKNDDVDLQFHLTLINTKYRKESSGKKNQKIDATPLLQIDNLFDLGLQKISEIHLSKLNGGSKQSEYYSSEIVLRLHKD